MRDEAVHLHRISEALRRLVAPAIEGFRLRNAIEARVDFDRVEFIRVTLEPEPSAAALPDKGCRASVCTPSPSSRREVGSDLGNVWSLHRCSAEPSISVESCVACFSCFHRPRRRCGRRGCTAAAEACVPQRAAIGFHREHGLTDHRRTVPRAGAARQRRLLPGRHRRAQGHFADAAIKGFQEANGLQVSGKLDTPTRQALLQQNRTSTMMVKLAADDVSGPVCLPVPEEAGGSGEAEVPGLPQHARESRRALSHHARHGRRVERAGQADRTGADAAFAECEPGFARLWRHDQRQAEAAP